MATIIGVRFKNAGKVYYFDPGEHAMEKGSQVVVETARGVECGEVVIANKEVAEETIVKPLKPVLRPATQEDIRRSKENAEKEKRAFKHLSGEDRRPQAGHEAGGCGIHLRQYQDPVLFHRRRAGGFPGAGEGSGFGVPHPHRAAADRRAG